MEPVHEKPSCFFKFEELRIYHKTLEYLTFLNSRLIHISFEEKEMLAIPFHEAARNIANQITEGSSRNKNQFIYHLKAAKTSIRECVTLTNICRSTGHFSEQDSEQSRQFLMELTKMIGALITSLVRAGVKECPPNDAPNHFDDVEDWNTMENRLPIE